MDNVYAIKRDSSTLTQPTDQNAIRLLKLHYGNSILLKIVASDTDVIINFLKSLYLYDGSCMIGLSWNNVKEDTLTKYWKKKFYFWKILSLIFSGLFHGHEGQCIRRKLRLLSTIFSNVSKFKSLP